MQIGDKIPEVLGYDQDNILRKSSDFQGKPWILYFYPKDNTSGCTDEACSLRDAMEDITEAGYTVIGVSKDSAKSHQGFISKYNLPFPLIADVEHTLQEAMGVWIEKKLYGRAYMGTERSTFLIDAQGVIQHIWRGKEVKTKEHAQQILKHIKTL